MTCCGPKTTSGEYKFNADYHTKPFAHKFYSKYESFSTIDNSKVLFYEKEIEKINKYDARCHSKMPRYTNQIYGWLPGYKINFLQKCDGLVRQNSANQKVAKSFMQHLKAKKPLTDYCACEELLKAVGRWKIV